MRPFVPRSARSCRCAERSGYDRAVSNGDQPLPSPDATQPDEAFSDGDYVYELSVLPAAFPVRLAQHDGATPWDFGLTILMLLGMLTEGLITRLFDHRWKVVAMRRLNHRRSPWIAVGVEFLATAESAESRRTEMIRYWVPGHLATAPGIPSDQLRRIRRTSRRTG